MQYARRVFKYDKGATNDRFDLATGSGTTTVNLPPLDLSSAQALMIELQLTTVDTDAADSLDVKLQDTSDGTVWNTRCRFPLITGDQSPTEAMRMVIQNHVMIASTEESYRNTGAALGVEIAAGAVVNGPFPPPVRNSDGRSTAWRLQFVRVDADSDADWVGTVTIWALSDYSR